MSADAGQKSAVGLWSNVWKSAASVSSKIRSYGAELWSRPLFRRPITWVGGIVATLVAAYLSGFLGNQVKTVISRVSDVACSVEAPAPTNSPTFTILLSPLIGDDANHTQLHRLLETFLGQKGFRPRPICETVSFDFDAVDASRGLDAVEDATLSKAKELIKKNKADLLLFGEVIAANSTLKVWAVNEIGGCELHPKPVFLQSDVGPEQFSRQTATQLLEVSLTAIASACHADPSTDWSAFKDRVQKLSNFVNGSLSVLSPDQAFQVYHSYSDALSILYENGQGDEWLTKVLAFDFSIISKLNASNNHFQRFLIWDGYAYALDKKAAKTNAVADRDAAIDAYNNAISEANRDSDSHAIYGEAFNVRGSLKLDAQRFQEAIDDESRALLYDPDMSVAYASRGTAHYDREEYSLAVADYTKALKLDSKDAWTYVNLGNALLADNAIDRAIKNYDRGIALQPRNAVFLVRRGFGYMKKRDWPKARADFDTAMSFDPKNAEAYEGRSLLHFQNGEFVGAIADATQAIDRDPDDVVAFFVRTKALFLTQEYAKVVADCDKLVAMNPVVLQDVKVRSNFFTVCGQSAEGEGDDRRALADFDEAVRGNPANAEAMDERADLYRKKSDYQLAIKDNEQAILIDPKNAKYVLGLGSTYYAMKDYDEAITEYTKALSLDPKYSVALNNRGHVYRHKGRCDLGIPDFNHALDLNPNFFFAISGRALCYYALQKYALAISDFKAALALMPRKEEVLSDRAVALYGLGLALEKSGDDAAGQKDIEAALAAMSTVVSEFAGRF